MTEATWSRHPHASDLCHLRKQNKRDNEKTEISPRKAKSSLDSNYTNPWCGLDRSHAQDHIAFFKEQPWTTVRSCWASSAWHSLFVIMQLLLLVSLWLSSSSSSSSSPFLLLNWWRFQFTSLFVFKHHRCYMNFFGVHVRGRGNWVESLQMKKNEALSQKRALFAIL